MTKQGWSAIILAIIFPSVALIVVVATGNHSRRPPRPKPQHSHFKLGENREGHLRTRGEHPGDQERHKGPRADKKLPPLPKMPREFALTPSQIEKMHAIRGKMLARHETLLGEIKARELELDSEMKKPIPDRVLIAKKLAVISVATLKLDTAHIFSGLDTRATLTAKQQDHLKKRYEKMQRNAPLRTFSKRTHFNGNGKPPLKRRGPKHNKPPHGPMHNNHRPDKPAQHGGMAPPPPSLQPRRSLEKAKGAVTNPKHTPMSTMK